MRGLIASFLTLLMLLNIGVYYALFWGVEFKTSIHTINTFNTENYDSEETLLIKVPISIPHASDSKEFERVDGIFEHEGQVYRLIKQKLAKDTLHVVVFKDKISTQIQKVKNDFAKSLTDQPVEKNQSNSSKIFKHLLKDYLPDQLQLVIDTSEITISSSIINYFNLYSHLHYKVIAHPPELV